MFSSNILFGLIWGNYEARFHHNCLSIYTEFPTVFLFLKSLQIYSVFLLLFFCANRKTKIYRPILSHVSNLTFMSSNKWPWLNNFIFHYFLCHNISWNLINSCSWCVQLKPVQCVMYLKSWTYLFLLVPYYVWCAWLVWVK